MKNIAFSSLLLLLTCFCTTRKPKSVDSYFEVFHKYGCMRETLVSKFTFDASEAIILTGIATNYRQSDSSTVTIVPHGANNVLRFSLKNLFTHKTINFDLMEIGGWVTLHHQGENGAINLKIAPGKRAEIFSFNLRDVLKQVPSPNPSISQMGASHLHFQLDPGVYEFTWSVSDMIGYTKPLFFEIR